MNLLRVKQRSMLRLFEPPFFPRPQCEEAKEDREIISSITQVRLRREKRVSWQQETGQIKEIIFESVTERIKWSCIHFGFNQRVTYWLERPLRSR